MKKLIAAALVVLMTAPALAQGDEQMRREMKERIEMFEQMLAKMKMEYERQFGKMEKNAEPEETPEVELKPGEMLFLLKDGNKVKGKLSIDSLNLNTSYGTLAIPANQIRRLEFAGKGENEPEKDTVETIEFTASGSLEIEKMEVETKHGNLTFKKGDIKNILFPPPAGEKSFKIVVSETNCNKYHLIKCSRKEILYIWLDPVCASMPRVVQKRASLDDSRRGQTCSKR